MDPVSIECSDAKVTEECPFPLLAGEAIVHSGKSADGPLIITNYRLHLVGPAALHIPLGLIENVELRELFFVHVLCKDARTFRLTFTDNETGLKWSERLIAATNNREPFALQHALHTPNNKTHYPTIYANNTKFQEEMDRLGFGYSWRISSANSKYTLCPSYPPLLLVPSCISDDVLESVAKFRSSRRIPAVVWRHGGNGAILARCSQPEVGWLGWRSAEDEDLVRAISEACAFYDESDNVGIRAEFRQKCRKVLIVDARSYTTAVANRARGGGCECPEYYPNCDIQFMSLANIHTVRKSFHALRLLCAGAPDQLTWFGQLESTRWLQHIAGLLRAAATVAGCIEREARPVLVHCSDGWDRTPQIVALAQLLLDPHYRTLDGFRTLVEREWLSFGHKFADRCGLVGGCDDVNERCPVFLQWLDCVHQLQQRHPCAFEFSPAYLVKLAQHTYSNLYGTFLYNTQKERYSVQQNMLSVWDFLRPLRNLLYDPSAPNLVLWPSSNIRDLRLWSELYLGTMELNDDLQQHTNDTNTRAESDDNESSVLVSNNTSTSTTVNGNSMTKTRSYGDLPSVECLSLNVNGRRNSDSNISTSVLLTDDQIDGLHTNTIDCTNGTNDANHMISNGHATETDQNQTNCTKSANQDDLMDDDGLHNVETSTETLVPTDLFEKIPHQREPAVYAFSSSDDASLQLSATPPPRAPSTSWDNFPINTMLVEQQLGADGLPPLRSPVQERLEKIVEDHKRKEDLLQRDLHAHRQARVKTLCHRCLPNSADMERTDDANSVTESIGSVGEGQASGVSSLRSDLSWEAVDDLADAQTLWVPDHAVSSCTACKIEFWMGRRKHHCRKCGRIFCADCSVHSTPLPAEHLYDPVRVCTLCYHPPTMQSIAAQST